MKEEKSKEILKGRTEGLEECYKYVYKCHKCKIKFGSDFKYTPEKALCPYHTPNKFKKK